MDSSRTAVLGLLLGGSLVPLGYFFHPPGMTLAHCADSSELLLVGVRERYVVRNDGCNDHYFPLLAVFGAVSAGVGSGFGIHAIARRLR